MLPHSRRHNETTFMEKLPAMDARLHFEFVLCSGFVCSGLENKAAIRPRLDLVPAVIRAHTFLKNLSNMLIFLVNWREVIWFAEPNGKKDTKYLFLLCKIDKT